MQTCKTRITSTGEGGKSAAGTADLVSQPHVLGEAVSGLFEEAFHGFDALGDEYLLQDGAHRLEPLEIVCVGADAHIHLQHPEKSMG